jgi:hypothetical protein
MRVLKLGAVNLDQCPRIPEEDFGRGFNHSRLS